MLFRTKPLPIIDLPARATHYSRGRAGFTPELIVLHHSGGVDSRDWLTWQSKPAPVSTHRLIRKDGSNYKIVADEHVAFTAGFGIVGPVDPDGSDPAGVAPNLNYISLHIELENLGNGRDFYPPAQLDMAAAQVVEWWGKYGYIGLTYHKRVDARKDDPRGFDWMDFSRRLDLMLLTQRVEV